MLTWSTDDLLLVGYHSARTLDANASTRSRPHSTHHLLATDSGAHHAPLHRIWLLRPLLLTLLHHARQVRPHSRVLLAAGIRIARIAPLIKLGHHVLAAGSNHTWSSRTTHRNSADSSRLLLLGSTHGADSTDTSHVTSCRYRSLHHRRRHLRATRMTLAEAAVRGLLSSCLLLNLF